ncbi:hypothetical protein DFH08DRAFT_835710 [Mycena albidolilacea]|uniref:Transcription factor CBF/NF-Y/archaeal histone domain-containing protein n=1 Tax=Mycena albidolilacea TaxID=1033008 RepID=A0AAD7F3G7_9AGAR|nr:hypothetical protein DFH08DRAFT_835710 [Mycena albidolilacea]
MDSEPATPSIVSVYESDPQALELEADDEEFDELNSDTDESGGIEPRIPGESILPSLRIENIIQADGVMGTLALSKEGLFIMSVATEEFIKRLVQGGQRQASVEQRTSVNYRDMARTTEQYQEFMFLKETIPTPVSLSEALQLRELHEKEMLEDDPALAAPTALSATVGHTPSTSKPKVKKAAVNGKDKQNRQGSSSSRGPSQVRWDYEDTPLSNDHNLAAQTIRGGRESGWTRWPNGQNFAAADPLPQHNGYSALAHQPPIPSANGHVSTAPRPETAPHPQHPNYWQRSAPWATGLLDASASRQTDSVSAPRAQTQAVNGSSARPSDSAPQTSVPAASSTAAETATPPIQVLDRPGGPPSLVAQNPGRTIYSQTKPQPQ